ncbi:g5419 [Coccomyxa elongata]
MATTALLAAALSLAFFVMTAGTAPEERGSDQIVLAEHYSSCKSSNALKHEVLHIPKATPTSCMALSH